MLTIITEPFSHLAQEAGQLTAAHWDEVEAPLHGQQHYTLDHERYASLERLDMLHISAARGLAGGEPCDATDATGAAAEGVRTTDATGATAPLAGYAAFTLVGCPTARKPCWPRWTACTLPLGHAAACLPCVCCGMRRRPLRHAG